LYVAERIADEVLETAYGAEYFTATEDAGPQESNGYANYLTKSQARQEQFRERLRLVSRFAGKPGRLLDYGCAVGLFVKVAKEAGWCAQGYERSPWAANYGRTQLGLDITEADGTLDPFGSNAFDVVTLWDVLEHLQNPREVLRMVANWISPGGLLALNTVNSSSLGARVAGP